MTEGWIKLHRKLLDNPLAEKPEWAWVWVVMLLKANHESKRIIFNGQDIDLDAGEFITGRKQLARETHTSEQTIRSIFDYLDRSSQITRKVTNKFTIIKICKYAEYQSGDKQTNQPATSQQPTNNQPATTDKNDKNVKNDKKISNNAKPPEGDVVDDLLKEGQAIQHEFQYVGLEIFEKMGAPANKRGECMRLAKDLGSNLCYSAMSWVSDYPGAGNKFKLFLWKINQLRKLNGTVKV